MKYSGMLTIKAKDNVEETAFSKVMHQSSTERYAVLLDAEIGKAAHIAVRHDEDSEWNLWHRVYTSLVQDAYCVDGRYVIETENSIYTIELDLD